MDRGKKTSISHQPYKLQGHSVIKEKCPLHGKTTFIDSDICQGWICLKCIKEGYFNEIVADQARQKYGDLFQ